MSTLAVETLEVVIVGRVTPDAVEALGRPLLAAVAAERRVTVLLDRSRIAGPTAAGRQALVTLYEHWDQIARLVLAWADVYDDRRASSLLRANAERAARGEAAGTPYPHRICRSTAEARTWLEGHARL